MWYCNTEGLLLGMKRSYINQWQNCSTFIIIITQIKLTSTDCTVHFCKMELLSKSLSKASNLRLLLWSYSAASNIAMQIICLTQGLLYTGHNGYLSPPITTFFPLWNSMNIITMNQWFCPWYCLVFNSWPPNSYLSSHLLKRDLPCLRMMSSFWSRQPQLH